MNTFNRRQKVTPIVRQLHPIRSHRQVAKMLGMSHMNVWLIERAALRKVQLRMLAATR